MTVAIVGYATEGEASAKYWRAKGADVTICDQNSSLMVPEGFKSKLGDGYLDDLDQFKIIVRTAGLHPTLITDKNPHAGAKITTGIEEFLKVCPSRNIIGVTGTKGKGTTTTLISKMLAASGKTVHTAGNIGLPPLELLGQIKRGDWVVLELSSFQLEDFKGPSPHIAVCLMVVPEHLNWHIDLQEYMAAKSRLFATQKPDDVAIYYGDNEKSRLIASTSPGSKIPYMHTPGALVTDDYIQIDGQQICTVSEIKLPGKHNLQNVCAAVTAVWQITQDKEAIKSVITSFAGLEHRIELVRELGGVKYYDDSFSTTPETAIAAIQAFENPKVLILGGSDKGIPLDPIADEVVSANVRHVIAIGDNGPVIEKLLRDRGFTNITTGTGNMSEIVEAARSHAQTGDVVLLSTGCASFDMFKDYKDRGDQFKKSVSELS